MPKLLFSKIQIYELKDLIQNVKQRRRIDILLSRRKKKKDFRCDLVHTTKESATSTKLSSQDGNIPHPNLENMLRDKKYLAAFQDFLRSEFSEENLEFWLACEDFRRAISPGEMSMKAEEIYREFLHPKAPREINVDHCIREKIRTSLEEPQPSCFDEAQRHIYLLMERDSGPRFLRSDAYQSLGCKTRTVWYM